jgi:hypothetical protein
LSASQTRAAVLINRRSNSTVCTRSRSHSLGKHSFFTSISEFDGARPVVRDSIETLLVALLQTEQLHADSTQPLDFRVNLSEPTINKAFGMPAGALPAVPNVEQFLDVRQAMAHAFGSADEGQSLDSVFSVGAVASRPSAQPVASDRRARNTAVCRY